jgi:hypothetical protein
MSDLVKRLRKDPIVEANFVGLMDEAADRIEALEKALREIVEAGDFWEMDAIARAALAPEQNKAADDELDATIEEMKRRHEE